MANVFGSPIDKRTRYTSPTASPKPQRLNISPFNSPYKHGLQKRKQESSKCAPPRVLMVALMAAMALTGVNLSLRFFVFESPKSNPTARSINGVSIHDVKGDKDDQSGAGHMAHWMSGHTKLAEELAEACTVHRHQYDFLWYGDSITESFREQVRGEPCAQRCSGIADVWEEHYGDAAGYTAAALGLAGDSTEQLLWRLRHGESPECPGTRAIVLLIGTNDLGLAALQAGPTKAPAAVKAAKGKAAEGVIEVFQALRTAAPDATILVLGILPRGLKDKWSDPGKEVVYHQQPSQFTSTIRGLNKKLKAFVEEQPNAMFKDCGELFLTDEGHLDPELMPDALHPGAAGMDLLANCVNEELLPVLAWHD